MSRLLARLGRNEAATAMAGTLVAGVLALLAAASTADRMHRSLSSSREALGTEGYDAFARGAPMSFDEMMDFALTEVHDARASGSR